MVMEWESEDREWVMVPIEIGPVPWDGAQGQPWGAERKLPSELYQDCELLMLVSSNLWRLSIKSAPMTPWVYFLLFQSFHLLFFQRRFLLPPSCHYIDHTKIHSSQISLRYDGSPSSLFILNFSLLRVECRVSSLTKTTESVHHLMFLCSSRWSFAYRWWLI